MATWPGIYAGLVIFFGYRFVRGWTLIISDYNRVTLCAIWRPGRAVVGGRKRPGMGTRRRTGELSIFFRPSSGRRGDKLEHHAVFVVKGRTGTHERRRQRWGYYAAPGPVDEQ